MMSPQAQTRRTMSNALALLEDLMESIDGAQKERLSQTIAELEAIENNLEENDEEAVSLSDTPHNTDSLPKSLHDQWLPTYLIVPGRDGRDESRRA
jgi:hypothetical protein